MQYFIWRDLNLVNLHMFWEYMATYNILKLDLVIIFILKYPVSRYFIEINFLNLTIAIKKWIALCEFCLINVSV